MPSLAHRIPRSERLELRLTPDEKKFVEKIAQQYDTGLSGAVRVIISRLQANEHQIDVVMEALRRFDAEKRSA